MSHDAPRSVPQALVAQIAQSPIFQDLAPADVAALAKMATIVSVPAREQVIEESAKGEDFFVILAGRVDITVALPDGKDSESLAILKEGDTLGESMLLGRMRRIASAVARDPVEAVRWDVVNLTKYLDAHPQAGYIVMRNLARIVHERLMATNMLLRNTLNRVVDMM